MTRQCENQRETAELLQNKRSDWVGGAQTTSRVPKTISAPFEKYPVHQLTGRISNGPFGNQRRIRTQTCRLSGARSGICKACLKAFNSKLDIFFFFFFCFFFFLGPPPGGAGGGGIFFFLMGGPPYLKKGHPPPKKSVATRGIGHQARSARWCCLF